ncbi:MAG: flagellar hook assembly protein FlgD [Caulobacterales bacterium]|nr:flagellar hook assembly protein FlgD [Caulobacterales bacterium]MCA0371289.1 flagellar hook assembly protein FlgD [Pseudomonadota bacterium]
MAVTGTNNNAAASAAANSASKSSTTGLAANFDTFMKLLTAQLRAQDPLSPLDTKDFTNQLVQFSGVEQQIKTNDLLTSLQTTMGFSAGSLAVSYLGKSATAETNAAGIVNGKASWNYNLANAAGSVTLKIYDSNNKLVKTIDGDKTKGSHTFEWDGTTTSGTKLTSGQFTMVVDAKTSSGEAMKATMTQKGLISNVDMSGSTPMVTINGALVALSAIKNVSLQSS